MAKTHTAASGEAELLEAMPAIETGQLASLHGATDEEVDAILSAPVSRRIFIEQKLVQEEADGRVRLTGVGIDAARDAYLLRRGVGQNSDKFNDAVAQVVKEIGVVAREAIDASAENRKMDRRSSRGLSFWKR